MRNIFEYVDGEHLAHHGIKGQKWGVRRFQNPDGSLTEAGKQRYLNENGEFDYAKYRKTKEGKKDNTVSSNYSKYLMKEAGKEIDKIRNMPRDTSEQRRQKADAELRILKAAENDVESEKGNTYYGYLFNEVFTKSGDWYQSKPVSVDNKRLSEQVYSLEDKRHRREREIREKFKSSSFKEQLSAIKNDPQLKTYKSQIEKLEDELDGVALRDIGFEDTPEARKYMRFIRVYD